MLLSKLLEELLILIGTTAVFLVLREKAIGPFVGKKAQAVLSKDVSTKRAVIVRGIIGAISMEALVQILTVRSIQSSTILTFVIDVWNACMDERREK